MKEALIYHIAMIIGACSLCVLGILVVKYLRDISKK